MGARITSTEGKHAMFDSVTGLAFGPVFDTEEMANEFLEWIDARITDDVRTMDSAFLQRAVQVFLESGPSGAAAD